jgi:hypothetical protein
LIEQIQVNARFALYGVHFSQAEFIAVLFIAVGVGGMMLPGRRALPCACGGTPTWRWMAALFAEQLRHHFHPFHALGDDLDHHDHRHAEQQAPHAP